MKKMFSLLLACAMILALAACGFTDNTSSTTVTENNGALIAHETITLTTHNGAGEAVEIEFPYNPERIAVMDLAALDILDNLGVTDPIVGVSKGSSIDYLQKYVTDDSLLNLGTVKEADLEAVMEAEPQVIFIGGRMAKIYDQLAAIAPVYMVYTDTEVGVVESTLTNAQNIAALFGLQDKVASMFGEYAARIEALQNIANGKNAIVSMVNAGGFGLLGNDGRCSIIGREIGFTNVGIVENAPTSEHGNEASFEFVLNINPEYIFVMDRDAAIGTKGAQLALEVMDNELVNKTTAAQNGNVIILEHSNVWYTAEGGITALGIMLSDLEEALSATLAKSTLHVLP